MTLSRRLALACLAATLAAGCANAQSQSIYEPQVGQQGKDVVWVPTHQNLVDRMLDMAGATPADYVIDLGSGDGRTVITAAKRGIRALGIEYNPDLVALSKANAEREGVTGKANFVQGDIFQTDFSQATVLTLFLLPDLNRRLRPTILNMKPGTRVVSNTFDMGDWEPDQTIVATGECTSYCRALKWIVPAKVDGTWRVGDGELSLNQTYQKLSGTLRMGGQSVPVTEARMNGAEIAFTAGERRFTGRVEGARMEGKMTGAGGEQAFSATRAGS